MPEKSLNLPGTYWEDVNRYCHTILATAALEKMLFNSKVWTANWRNELGARATLEKGIVPKIGILMLFGAKDTYHFLKLENDTDTGIRERFIVFDPLKGFVESDSIEPNADVLDYDSLHNELRLRAGQLGDQ